MNSLLCHIIIALMLTGYFIVPPAIEAHAAGCCYNNNDACATGYQECKDKEFWVDGGECKIFSDETRCVCPQGTIIIKGKCVSGEKCKEEVDCAGVCGGDTVVDCSGVCGGDAIVDCVGVCDGDALEDCAGVCVP
jgi:hypothetical protein